ncbi:hypothetical protein CFP66_03560 [Pseudonocardia sp. MH-G8]|nr:hypothetical protein CFP66_03560 [Pseudonocardia sp. MH-G8]
MRRARGKSTIAWLLSRHFDLLLHPVDIQDRQERLPRPAESDRSAVQEAVGIAFAPALARGLTPVPSRLGSERSRTMPSHGRGGCGLQRPCATRSQGYRLIVSDRVGEARALRPPVMVLSRNVIVMRPDIASPFGPEHKTANAAVGTCRRTTAPTAWRRLRRMGRRGA